MNSMLGITAEQKMFLPGHMPTVAYSKHGTRVMYYPRGVMGDWVDYKSIEDCLNAIGNGMCIITTTDK